MGSQGSLLGAGRLEVSPLLAGGAHLIDTWVELEVWFELLPCCYGRRSLEALGSEELPSPIRRECCVGFVVVPGDTEAI